MRGLRQPRRTDAGDGLVMSGTALDEAAVDRGGPLLPAAVGLGTSMLILETLARMTPSKLGTSAESSTRSSHTTLLSPSCFLNRKWYEPGSGKCCTIQRPVVSTSVGPSHASICVDIA